MYQYLLLTMDVDNNMFHYLLLTLEVAANQLYKLVALHLNMCPLCLYSLHPLSIRSLHHKDSSNMEQI